MDAEGEKKLVEMIAKIYAEHKDVPIQVQVEPKDMDWILKGMSFRVAAWDNMDKEKGNITLQLIDHGD